MTDLMADFDELDRAAAETLKEAERTGEGVRLPFPVAYLHVINGDPRTKKSAKEAPALYYGGWAGDSAKIGELVEDGSVVDYPAGFVAFEGAGDKGSWDGLCARAVSVAVIANRQRWVSSDGKFSGPDFDREQGLTRRHLQLLTLLYSAGVPWGWAVLTAKGYQAQHVLQAMADWGRAINPFRKELNATQFGLSAFAITIGTYATEPEYVSVGQAATSKITPIRACLPSDLSADKVAKRFVGKNNLRANAEKLEQARDWLAAWKQPARGGVSNGQDEYEREQEEKREIPF